MRYMIIGFMAANFGLLGFNWFSILTAFVILTILVSEPGEMERRLGRWNRRGSRRRRRRR